MEISWEDGQYFHEYITQLKCRFHITLYEHFLICHLYSKGWVKAKGSLSWLKQQPALRLLLCSVAGKENESQAIWDDCSGI